jgi:hypothetical protein
VDRVHQSWTTHNVGGSQVHHGSLAGMSESSLECDPASAVVNKNSPRRCEEGEWVNAILTVGNKRWRSNRDEPAMVKGG